MLTLIERLLSAPWIYFITRIRRLLRWPLAHPFGLTSPCPFHLRPLTDQQRKQKANDFIDSIDTDAIRTLASQYNGGLSCSIRCRRQGSFNVCFILDFTDGTARLVRLPIEPAVHNAWDKIRSEVYTMQYVRDHTQIPIPRVYAYGRSRLRRGVSGHQIFVVLEYVDGQSLTKKILRHSSEECRRRFFGQVVDVFAQLRGLEFRRGGSLMPSATAGIWTRLRTLFFRREESAKPQSTMGLESEPQVVGGLLMRENELQVDGYAVPRSTDTTTMEFIEQQYRLLRYMWSMPSQELDREEAEREEFALHALSLEKAQKILGVESNSPGDSFYLSHPDFRVDNIIVDDELHILGVIDWEFSVTVPRLAFLPPPWLTGHDTGSIISKVDLSSEFMSALSSRKHLSSSHSQLAQDWDFRDDLRLPMGYIFLDPSNLVFIFYRFIYPKLFNEPRDKVVPSFFQRCEQQELQEGLERRLRASERYTRYLRDNDLFEDEEPEWEQIREWTVETQNKLQQLREWSDKAEDDLSRLDGERAVQRAREGLA